MKLNALLCILLSTVVAITGCHSKAPAPAKAPELVKYEQGETRLRNGDIAGAHAAFEMAMRLNTGFAPAYLADAEIQAKMGNVADAIARLETLRRAAPQTPHVLCRLAELHAVSGHFVEEVTAAQLAIQQEPDCPVAQTEYALALVAAGKMRDALAAIQAAHRLDPQNERASLVLAQLLARNGRPEEAWKIVDALPAKSGMPVQSDYLRGWLLAEYGRDGKRDDKQALEMLDRALAIAPDDGLANLEKGRILLRSGDARAALKTLQAAQHASEPSVELLSALAQAYTRLKSPDAPRQERRTQTFAKFVDSLYAARQHYLADPNSRDNLVKLARLEAEMGNVQDAQGLLTQVLKHNPNDAEALELMTPQDEDSNKPHSGKSGPG